MHIVFYTLLTYLLKYKFKKKITIKFKKKKIINIFIIIKIFSM